jgi:penicillin-binding protein 1C
MKTPVAKHRRWVKWLRRAAFTLAVLFLIAWIALKFVPVPEALLRTPPVSVEFTDRNGQPLRETRVGERFRREVRYPEIPANVVHAMLAAEDKRFFSHSGVDWLAAGRAAVSSVRAGRKTSGASTISQQLIKLSVPRPRTLTTKLIEMVTALRLEQIWPKEEILAAYLNRLDFGNLNFGVAAAANYYFGKPLSDLSNAEAALLAGLPWNPTRLNPHANPAAAKRRQETVLRRMHESGWLAQEEYERAIAEPLRYEKARRVFNAPHFVDLVLEYEKGGLAVAARARGDDLNLEGRKSGNGDAFAAASSESEKLSCLPAFQIQIPRSGEIRTTLDLDLNRFIERSVSERLASLRAQNVRDAAAVVLDNRTGEVLGFVGSENYFAPGSGMVNGAMQARSAGSTIKPVTYLLALERGDTPATVVPDVPTEFPTPTGPYRPENYHRHCQGPARYREALACSLNIPAVKVLQSLGGAAPLQKRLQEWGVTTLPKPADEYGLGLTIGNAEVRLLELANVYATLARMGEWRPVSLRLSVQRPTPNAQRPTVQRELCWLIADMLSDNAARTPAFGANSALRFDFPVACKTGTSTDFRDNWAMGYTPEFTVGVWVGNFNGSPMRDVSGVSGAGPILHDVMEYLHRRFGTTWFERLPEIVERPVHPLTGHLLAAPGPGAVMEKFVAGHFPKSESADDCDAEGRVKLGAEYSEWAASADNQIRDRVVLEDAGRLHLVSPQPGSTFLLDPDVPSSRLLPLVASGAGHPVWESPTLAFREQAGRTFAVAVEGRHELIARDPQSGQTVTTWVVVKAL